MLRVIGAVALTAGLVSVVLGAASVAGAGTPTPSLDSELRFYAAWYAVAGALALRASVRVESETFTVRAIAAGFFLAGCGRALSFAFVGRPHVVAVVLMVIELVIPFVLIPWQAAVARGAEGGQRPGR